MLDRRFVHVVTTAQCGSFTAAAERLGLTQSAITKSVGDLENQIGYPIFTRVARGVILTEDGRQFVERATQLIDESQELMRGSLGGSSRFSGVLKIGVCPASVDWLLVEPLTWLATRYKNLRFNVTTSSFNRTVEKLRSGAIDVALGFDDAFRQEADFTCERLPVMRTALFVRKGHPILEGGKIDRAALSRFEIIFPSESRPYGTVMRQIYEQADIDAQTKMHFIDSFQITSKLVASTNAIGIVSIPYTHSEAFKRRYVAIPFPFEAEPAQLCCATRVRFPPRPATRAFIKACRERIPLLPVMVSPITE